MSSWVVLFGTPFRRPRGLPDWPGRNFATADLLFFSGIKGRPLALDKLAADYGVEVPLTDFVYSDPYAVLSEGVLYGEYLGIHRFSSQPSRKFSKLTSPEAPVRC